MAGGISRRDGNGAAEASFAQERLWIMEGMAHGSCAFNMLNGYLIRGGLDAEALRKSVIEIIRRHEALRTNLVFSGGKVVQSVSQPSEGAFEFVDLGGVPEGARLGEARKRALGMAGEPYDLAKGLLFRTVLMKISEGEHVLAVLSHHSAFDGWSGRVFAGELAAIYPAMAEGKASPLPELPVQYGDYSEWQRRRHGAGEYEAQWEYWGKRLGGDLPVLELQTDRLRGKDQGFEGGVVTVAIPDGLRRRLKTLATKNGCTLYMALLAAYYAFLYRHSGSSDIVVGCPIAGRGERELEGMMGFFVNILPIRAGLTGRTRFTELLRDVRRLSLEAFRNQDLPFEKVVERLKPVRDLSHTPIYQTMFQLRNYPKAETHGGGIELEPFDFGWVTAQVDLTVDALETEQGILFEFEYPTSLFDRPSVERMARGWVRLLEGVVENPETEVFALPVMADEEREMLVRGRNATRTDYPREKCVHQIFEERAAEMPSAVAITRGGVSISYGELNERANRLAHRLAGVGVGAGSYVGVCMERSVEMVVAFIAILKAGGAYVPIDPGAPQERKEAIVGMLTGGLVVTASEGGGGLPPGAKAFGMDREAGGAVGSPAGNPPNRSQSERAAHVIFTSGSLGAPKGVCCPHRGVVRVAVSTNYVSIGRGDTVVHASSPVFDATTFEIFGALLNGARVLIVEKEDLLSSEGFARLLRKEGATVMFVTTALFNLKAREAPGTFGSLKTLMFGGEIADPSSASRVLAAGRPGRLLHMYGPTENTVFSTFQELTEVSEGAASLPIGKNISNSTSYILGRDLEPVPIGVKGEICVSGDGVALGYFGQPTLTAASFVPNPFEPGTFLYKTGDMGKFLPDGSIEFLGREDLQVKVRGFRVELVEVEAALMRLPSVKAGTVVARDGRDGKRLVAYVVPGGKADPEEMRREMRKRLPEYMVPATIVMLERLPLTATGKIDRRSLPEPGAEQPGSDGAGLEGRLAGIWSRAIGVPRVGADDNFFEIGGHSLLAVRLFSIIEEELGVRLPIAAIFRSPTVRQLAKEVAEAKPSRGVSLVPLRAGGARTPLFLVHAQDGDVYNYRHLVKALGEDQPVYGLRAVGLYEDVPLPGSIEEVAGAYLREVRGVRPHGPYHLAGWCLGSNIVFEMANQLRRAGEEVGLVGLMDNEYSCPEKYRSHRWARIILLRESLSIIVDLINFRKRRIVSRDTGRSLRLPWRIARAVRIWMRVLFGVPFDGVVLPGEAMLLPETWKRTIMNLSRLSSAYTPPKYDGTVTVLKKESLPTFTSRDITNGWRGQAAGIYVAPAGGKMHGGMFKPPHVQGTALVLRERMDWHEGRLKAGRR